MKNDRDAAVTIIVRKRRGHEAHHGGAWKVAFADFMTAMFALFLVLWLINQSTDIKSAIAGYFQDPLGRADEFGSSIMPGEGAQAQTVRNIMISQDVLAIRRDRLQKVAKSLQESMASGAFGDLAKHVEITLTDEGLKIELIEDSGGFFFERGNANPSPGGSKILGLLGTELGALPFPIRVEGHTDAHPYREQAGYTNWELSADRANSARRILCLSGLAPAQIVQVRAMADQELKLPEDRFSARNRRVTIMVLLQDAPAEGTAEGTAVGEAEARPDASVPPAGAEAATSAPTSPVPGAATLPATSAAPGDTAR